MSEQVVILSLSAVTFLVGGGGGTIAAGKSQRVVNPENLALDSGTLTCHIVQPQISHPTSLESTCQLEGS